jgi:CheY-like chemotaxis protein
MPVMDGYQATKILRCSTSTSCPDNTTFNTPNGALEAESDEANSTKVLAARKEMHGMSDEERVRIGSIPVIAMTASAIQGDKEKCTDAGMDDYLAKPVEKRRLEAMLVKWATRRKRE